MILHNSNKKTQRLKAIQNKLQKLATLDIDFKKNSVSSGEAGYRYEYKLNPVLSLVDLMEFEKKHQLQLPLEYELYLTEIANGGVLPIYELYSIDRGLQKAKSYSTQNNKSIQNSFTIDFPYSNKETKKFILSYNKSIADGEKDKIKYLEIKHELTGVIFLSEYNHGWFHALVVKGEQAGTVWSYGEYLCPLFVGNRQWSFFDWFEDLLNKII